MQKKLIYRQRDIKDCGICSLASIIKYYNGNVPLEYLRNESLTNNSGTTAYHLIKTAQKIGFEAKGLKLNQLFDENIKLPAIAHVTLPNGLNHYVVIYNIKKNKIILMDPSVGKKIMPLQEFSKIWNKFLIILFPRRQILQIKENKILLDILKLKLLDNKKILFYLIITNIVSIITAIFLNYYIQIILETTAITMNKELLYLIFIFGILLLIKLINQFYSQYYANYLYKNIDYDLYQAFITHTLSLPLKVIKSRTSGEIISRFYELKNIKHLLTSVYLSLALNLILGTTSIFLLYKINPQLIKLLIVILVIYSTISILFSKITYQKIISNIDEETETNAQVLECIENIDSIKNTNSTNCFFNKTINQVKQYLNNNFHLQKCLNIQDLVKNIILDIGIFIINSYALILIINNKMTIISFFTFNTFIMYLLEPLKEIIAMLPKYNYLRANIIKINDFFNNNKEPLNYKKEKFNNGDIIFKNVSYSPNNYKKVLENFNMIIPQSAKVNIVGPSGSGKSTICKLLFRLDNVNNGQIKIGGVNINDYNLYTIRNSIGYISQNESLFNATILENITLGGKYSAKKITQIIELCELSDTIDNHPLRLNTFLDKDSTNFSGGEIQRLILARTLFQNREIIILDEALSEVSLAQEKRIIKNIINFFPEKTLIYISHKNVSNLFEKKIIVGAND